MKTFYIEKCEECPFQSYNSSAKASYECKHPHAHFLGDDEAEGVPPNNCPLRSQDLKLVVLAPSRSTVGGY